MNNWKLRWLWWKTFNLDNELPINKTIEIPNMIVVVRAVFHENNKYYLEVFLNECVCKWII